MTTYLTIQTIVLAVAAGLIIYGSSYRKSQTSYWIDHTDLFCGIGLSVILIFALDVFAFIMYHGINR